MPVRTGALLALLDEDDALLEEELLAALELELEATLEELEAAELDALLEELEEATELDDDEVLPEHFDATSSAMPLPAPA